MPTTDAIDLSLDELIRASHVRLRPSLREKLDTFNPGEWSGRRLGQGLHLESIGPYQPGDDIRHIDWNATARIGHPQVKRFHMDIQWTLMFAIDLRASMYFGSQRQLMAKTACLTSAWLAFALSPAHQRVGFVLLKGDGPVVLSPLRGRQARLQKLVMIHEAYQAGIDSAFKHVRSLDTYLEPLADVMPVNSALVLVSDFSAVGQNFIASLVALSAHRPSAVIVEDAMQQTAPSSGRYPLLKNPQTPIVTPSFGRREKKRNDVFNRAIDSQRESLRSLLVQAGINDALTVDAEQVTGVSAR